MIKFSFSIFVLLVCISCTNKSENISRPKVLTKKAKIIQEKMTRSDINKMKKKMIFVPRAGDISPEGFNWVHYDFALFFSGAFYEHGLKGKYREEILKEKRPALKSYLKTLSVVKRRDFNKWNKNHRTSFLINTYHANLINLMIARDFKELDKKIYKVPNQVLVFNNSYSLEEFVKKEILSGVDDYRVAFVLKCFEENCPEFRNTIYNYKNVESLVRISSVRYFIDSDIDLVKKGKIKLPYIQSLFAPLMPRHQRDFKNDLSLLLKDVKEGKEVLRKIDISKKL